MIGPNLILPYWDEIFVDGFAGGGGTSTGVSRALNRHPDEALNHNRKATAMHRMNHQQTRHHCEDIRKVDPRAVTLGRPVGGMWVSPDCTHFTKARQGKPKSKKIRGLAWTLIHWVNKLRDYPRPPRVFYLENVEEFLSWCPLAPDGSLSGWRTGEYGWFFLCFTGALFRRGYHDIEWAPGDGFIYRRTWGGIERVPDLSFCTRACTMGAPTIRRRLYMIARCDGRPILWPAATHAAPDTPGLKRSGLKPYRMTAECVDWPIPCPSIFLTRAEAKRWRCKRPLVKASLQRIAAGVDRYVLKSARPFIVSLTHQGGDRVESVDAPANTITGAHRGEKALVMPLVAYAQHGGAVRPADAPMHTITASPKDQNQLIVASVVKMRGKPKSHAPGHSMAEPVHTISAQGTHHGMVAAYVAQHNAGYNTTTGHPVDQPVTTITNRGSQQQLVAAFLAKYYGTDQDPRLDEPCHTVTTKDRFGLVQCFTAAPPFGPEHVAGARRVAKFLRAHGVEFEGEFATVAGLVIWDLGMRMFSPRELFRMQGFPDNYVIAEGLDECPKTGRLFKIKLTKTEQVMMCGNSVSPPMAEALVAANNPEMRWEEKAA